MSLPKVSNELLLVQLRQVEEILRMDPHTELPLQLAAPCLGKTLYTLRSDVTRRPADLPRLTRRGKRIFITVGDLREFRSRSQQQPQPQPRRRGAPTMAERIARQGGAS